MSSPAASKPVVPATSFPEVSRLVAPVPVAQFWHDYFERKPLHVRRDDQASFADLLSLDGIDKAISLASDNLSNIRIVKDGKEVEIKTINEQRGHNGYANALETLYEAYRGGKTIVINALERRWQPLQTFTSALGAELDARMQVNIYLTPPGSRGFKPHYDTHDVFIVQVHGSKRWRLAGIQRELPLRDEAYDGSQPEPETLEEFDMLPGDTLYLPRGAVHSGAANETASLHMTIGLHPVLWSQILRDAVAQTFADDVRFRHALPPGFTRDEQRRQQVTDTLRLLRDALYEHLDPEALTGNSIRRATSKGPAVMRNHLLDLEDLPTLTMDTPVRHRSDARGHFTVDDSVARLHFFNKVVRFPAEVADEVRMVAEHGPDWFTARTLPGDLDDQGRKTLVHTLVREGFLTLR